MHVPCPSMHRFQARPSGARSGCRRTTTAPAARRRSMQEWPGPMRSPRMNDHTAVSTARVRERVSAEEWAAREDLAACYRLAAYFRMTDLIYTHISARVPGPQPHFLINAFGQMWDEIT